MAITRATLVPGVTATRSVAPLERARWWAPSSIRIPALSQIAVPVMSAMTRPGALTAASRPASAAPRLATSISLGNRVTRAESTFSAATKSPAPR